MSTNQSVIADRCLPGRGRRSIAAGCGGGTAMPGAGRRPGRRPWRRRGRRAGGGRWRLPGGGGPMGKMPKPGPAGWAPAAPAPIVIGVPHARLARHRLSRRRAQRARRRSRPGARPPARTSARRRAAPAPPARRPTRPAPPAARSASTAPITTTTTTTTSSTPAATIEYLHETAAGQAYYRFRITFDPAFVDNTYGVNAIGWATEGPHVQGPGRQRSRRAVAVRRHGRRWSRCSTSTTSPPIRRRPAATARWASAAAKARCWSATRATCSRSTTSLDRNLNGCGYCKSAACGGDCTVDSPATDAQLHAQPRRAQLGLPRRLRGVDRRRGVRGQGIRRRQHHVRPRVAVEGQHEHRQVTPKPCGGGGGCPYNQQDFITSEGTKTCVPIPGSGGCPAGYAIQLQTEGAACLPVPVDGTCPAGFRYDFTFEIGRCI